MHVHLIRNPSTNLSLDQSLALIRVQCCGAQARTGSAWSHRGALHAVPFLGGTYTSGCSEYTRGECTRGVSRRRRRAWMHGAAGSPHGQPRSIRLCRPRPRDLAVSEGRVFAHPRSGPRAPVSGGDPRSLAHVVRYTFGRVRGENALSRQLCMRISFFLLMCSIDHGSCRLSRWNRAARCRQPNRSVVQTTLHSVLFRARRARDISMSASVQCDRAKGEGRMNALHCPSNKQISRILHPRRFVFLYPGRLAPRGGVHPPCERSALFSDEHPHARGLASPTGPWHIKSPMRIPSRDQIR